MTRFRKRPVVIDAVRLTPDMINSTKAWPDWLKAAHIEVVEIVKDKLLISTPEGELVGRIGDYIIKGIGGEIYPCKEDIFLQSYEPVDPPVNLDNHDS